MSLNGKSGDERIKIIMDSIENDKCNKNDDDLFYYEKDGKKNKIIGKDNENFSYYFAKLLKTMDDNGYFDKMIDILKDKPTVEDLYNIFSILMNCTSYIHKDFYKENYDIFKDAYFKVMDNLSTKEMRNVQKEVKEMTGNFFMKINYLISPKEDSSLFMDEINLISSLKMIKSSIFDKKIQGLKAIGEYINSISDEERKKNIIDLIKKNDIIKELFGNNYHTQIISKSMKL
jgi:hypothetical protein